MLDPAIEDNAKNGIKYKADDEVEKETQGDIKQKIKNGDMLDSIVKDEIKDGIKDETEDDVNNEDMLDSVIQDEIKDEHLLNSMKDEIKIEIKYEAE